jgi:hypothetical protein
MKTFLLLCALCGALTSITRAGVEVKISVKFIHGPGAMPPVTVPGGGNIDLSTSAAFDAEIAHGNRVLDATGRACRLRVIEYINIQPPDPGDQPAGFWYNLDARRFRQVFETAALASPGVWAWNGNGVLNIYVNNSSSGSCSFIGTGDSISLGATIFTQGTVLHEIGHFFDLSHTHSFDPGPPVNECVYGDGDGLAETLPDNGCFTTMDQLSMANFGVNYATLNAFQRQAVDDTWFNVMSYHVEARLLNIQMDYWCTNANGARHAVCDGFTWFVATNGLDPFSSGLTPGQSFATVPWALAHVSSPNDVVLLRPGNYGVPATITTPCTLSSSGGAVTLTR